MKQSHQGARCAFFSMNSTSETKPVTVKMRRSNAACLLPAPAIPASMIIRRAIVDDASALAELLGHAYPSESWTTEGTEVECFQDNTVKATLVVVDHERMLATASLQVRSDLPEIGQVRWVATALDQRCTGLAKILVTELFGIAETIGCRETRLQTTTNLSGAIALYLQLGFKPLVCSDDERTAWQRVFRLLNNSSS